VVDFTDAKRLQRIATAGVRPIPNHNLGSARSPLIFEDGTLRHLDFLRAENCLMNVNNCAKLVAFWLLASPFYLPERRRPIQRVNI